MRLRNYQINLSNVAIKALESIGIFCLVLPTQTGKTPTVGSIMKNGGYKTIFVTPRKFITFQGSIEFKSFFDKNEIAYVNSSTSTKKIKILLSDPKIKVLVVDIETVISRIKNKIINPKLFDLVAVDECHYAPLVVQELMSLTRNCKQLGITATPHDEKGIIIDYYGKVDIPYSPKYMVQNNFLSNLLVYHIDIGERPTLEAMFRASIDPRNNILKSSSDRALVYVSSIEEAKTLENWYKQYKFKAVAVHSESKEALADISRFNNNDFNILISIDMLFMGVVIKGVKNSIVMRSISSMNTLVQLSGRSRGSNPSTPNKLYDLTGFSLLMGHADDVVLTHDKKEIKETLCNHCGSDLKKYPERILTIKSDGSYYFSVKECVVCHATRETHRTLNKKELFNGSFGVVELNRDIVLKGKMELYIKKTMSRLSKSLLNRKIDNVSLIIDAISNNINEKITFNNNYLSDIVNMVETRTDNKLDLVELVRLIKG